MKYYPRQLSHGANNKVVALSETEVGKIFSNETQEEIDIEAEKMLFANAVNGLVVKFHRIDNHPLLDENMIVMERIYPIDFRSYEVEMREIWFDVFEDQLKELHAKGFVHHDLRRLSHNSGQLYDNILLTSQGIRLIDIGISVLERQVGKKFFSAYVEQELKELAFFKEYFLNR